MKPQDLIGKRIINVLPITEEEMNALGWYGGAIKIVLSDGSVIIPSSDEEGNDAGSFYVFGPGDEVMIL